MTSNGPYQNGDTSPQSSLPQPYASTSKLPTGNPQLGPNPFFSYPTPQPQEVEEELPPVFEGDNVPLGALLNRVVRKGYGELRGLTESTLPSLSDRQKPQPIIAYSRSTRQSILKYLAVLRWKSQVDVPVYAALNVVTSPQKVNGHVATSFPTPHSSNGSTDSPGAYTGKGKGKATDESQGERVVVRGKVTDAKRIEVFMAHQNAQHSAAIEHLRHTSKVVDGLRLRNPDLLTAMSVLSLGTYSRLPTSLTETFLPKPPLTNTLIISTLRKLNRHIRYRLKCMDYVPTDLVILEVKDGRVYVEGSGGQWKAELTIINFGNNIAENPEESKRDRWWLTGVEWGWREKVRQKGVDDPGGSGRRLEGEERKAVLDLANMEILPWREIPDLAVTEVRQGVVARRAVGLGDDSIAGSPASVTADSRIGDVRDVGKKVDAPLVRIYNFLQHLCLTYQLEVLYTQAMNLANGSRRGQLSVELDRTKKILILRYWLRPRPVIPAPTVQPGPKRPNQPPIPDPRQPLVGGILSISLIEDPAPRDQADNLLAEIQGDGSSPTERLLRLKLGVKWQVGESGEGAGWKFGDILDSSNLIINPSELSISDLLDCATSTHAAHLTRHHCTPLLSLSRLSIFPSDPPTLFESPSDSSTRPLSLRVPLPSRQKATSLLVGVSTLTGMIEIQDEGAILNFEMEKGKGAMEDRGKRAKMASGSVNDGKSRLGDDIGRLITAIITENVEFQMKALGYNPVRRLPMRPQDLAKADLHPASSIFLNLPTSNSQHHLITKVTSVGIIFEVLQLIRVPTENGTGMKLVIGERVGVDRERIKGGMRIGKRKREGMEVDLEEIGKKDQEGKSAFVLDIKELRDMFIYSNALVAQSIIESQLKTRSIPYILQLPPTSGPGAPKSRSPIAGLIPTFVVNSADLLKDGKAGDVAMPKVYIQVKNWWGGGKCTAVTVVQLRHRPSTVSSYDQPKSSKAAQADGITFDQSSSVVKFDSVDLDHCVGGFLEQWERLSKVIIVAGTVNKLNKIPSFKDVKMLSFDLRTASLEYSPGYICSITYDSTTDGYLVTFGKRLLSGKGVTPGSTSGQTPGTILGDEGGNPHSSMSGLLSWELNELVENGKDVGIRFIGLLRASLPFLLEVESLTSSSPGLSPPRLASAIPKLVILTIRRYRVIWDTSDHRSGIDISLLPDNKNWIISDSASSQSRGCGRIREISGFKEIVGKVWDRIRSGGEEGSPGSRGNVKMENVRDEGGMKMERSEVTAVKLDEGKSLLVSAEVDGVVALAVRMFVKEIGGALG